ncbi:MAG: hypothetical protein KDJ65_39375, partial [Anaerolineae bacterium]|nr:hypothetical protein [Anaerolineae bacterium]
KFRPDLVGGRGSGAGGREVSPPSGGGAKTSPPAGGIEGGENIRQPNLSAPEHRNTGGTKHHHAEPLGG